MVAKMFEAPLPLSSPRRRCRFLARSPRPESLILMILSDKLTRGASSMLLQGFSNLDLDSSPSETERLRLVLRGSQMWTWTRAPLKQRGSGWWSTFLSEAISDPIESLPSTPGCRSGLWAKGELLTKFKIEPGWLPSSPSPSAPPSCLAHLALPPLHFFLNSNFFRSVFYLSPSAPPSKPRKLMSTPSTNLRKRSHLSVSMCATLELID